jgi:hypothetical protein
MPNDKEPWYVLDRSEALAGLLLTSRQDVRVVSEQKKDDGVDFLVEVGAHEGPPSQLLVVQVKGTSTSDWKEWLVGAQNLFTPGPPPSYLPACIFLVNVRENQLLYAWLAEPVIEKETARLRLLPKTDFRALDEAAVGEIVQRVNAWYDVLHKQLVA